MSRHLILFITLFLVILLGDLHAQSPSWQYVNRLGSNQYYTDGVGNKNDIKVLAHMFDSQQNQYLMLYFSGDSFFYNDFSYIRAVPLGCGGAALLKLRCDGSVAWSKILSNKDKTEADYITRYSLCFGKDENSILLGFNVYSQETIRIDSDTTIYNNAFGNVINFYSVIYDSLGVKKQIVYRNKDTGQAQVNGYIPASNQYYLFKFIDSVGFPITFKGVKQHSGDYLILLDSNFGYNKIIPINKRRPNPGFFADTTQPLMLTQDISFSNPNLLTFVVNHKIYYYFNYQYERNDNSYKKRLIVSSDTVDFSNWGYKSVRLSGFFVYNDTGKFLFSKYSRPIKGYKNSTNAYSHFDDYGLQLGKDKNFYYMRSEQIEDTVMIWGQDTIKSNLPNGSLFMNYGAIDTNGKHLWSNNLEIGTNVSQSLFYKLAITPDNHLIMAHELPKFNTSSSYKIKIGGKWYNNDTFTSFSGFNNKIMLMRLKQSGQEVAFLAQNGRREVKIDYLSVNTLGDIHLFGNKAAPGYIINNDSSDIFYQGTYRDFFIAKYGKAQCNCDTVTASFTTDTSQLAKIKVQYTGTATDSVLYIWGDDSQTWVKPANSLYTKTYTKDTIVTIQCIAYNNCRQPSIASKTHKIPCDTVNSNFIIIDSNIRGRTAVKYKGSRVDSVIYLWGNGSQSIAKPDTMILSKVYNKDTIVTIACIAFNQCGRADTSYQTVHILCDTPTNNFDIVSNLNGTVSAVYKGSSIDTVNFLWGDGQQSKVFNPSTQTTNHTYTNLNSDSAKISCVIKNKCGIADTLTKTVPIVCDTPTNLFRIKSSNNRTLALEYYGNSTDTITFVLGDGNQIKVSNPTTQVMNHTYTNLSLDSVNIACEVKNKCGKKTTTALWHKFCQPQIKFQTITICDTNHLLTKSTDTNLIFQNWSDGTTTNTKTISASQKMTGIYLKKNGCGYRDSFDIVKYTSPTLQKSKNYLDCKKTPITLSVSNAVATGYLWSTAATSASISVSAKGDYSVRITHPCGIFRDTIKVFDTATSVYDTLRKTVCEKYLWRDTTYTKTGKYTRTISKPNSCDSILTLDLKVGLEPKVTLSNGINYRVEEDFKSYQWYLCSPWKKINNETKKTFTTLTRGSYAVIVSNGECVDTSDCRALYSSSIVTPAHAGVSKTIIYPNPVQDKLNIALPRISKKIELSVYNLLGRRVVAKEYSHQESIVLNTSDLTIGIYILELESTTGKEVFKFIKE